MTSKRPTLSRRALIASGSALPLAPAFAAGASAAAPMQESAPPTHHRITVGDVEVTALLAGTRTSTDDPQGTFGMNVDKETFQKVSAEHFIPADANQFFFTPTLVNTGSSLILFDTGLNAEGITGALAAAGYTPDQIDTVVLTHMHPDHIGGLMTDGAPTFANAGYVTGQVEYDSWVGGKNEAFAANVQPLAEKVTFIGDGDSVVSGITSVAAFGHTPGHMGYMIESGGKQLMLTADTANHYVWSLGHPDWEVRFDADKAMAAEARRKVFGMLAADRVPFLGYHMPFPAMGYVEAAGDGFRFVPVSYQFAI